MTSQSQSYAHEQEESIMHQRASLGHAGVLEEPDEYEIPSDTEEEGMEYSSSSEEEEKSLPRVIQDGWSRDAHEYTPQEFILSSGLTRSSSKCSSPLSFFRLFITDQMMEQIVKATNQ